MEKIIPRPQMGVSLIDNQ